ncbi:DnaJ-domain-containing protein [Lophiostoma macrostomum CBS 122681]|uniref:DnaJ-domain-containing protein n=1 Tax=Lophiostoma macrostomum CBS 122681 TaxID=1314788 RepID=A0A6A6SUY0_9PLEO|nr:DnaJ-domain-containing protein [Lophiostoma macrostomum CBS 122681]
MEPATHYTTLGLIRSAPLPVIKASYKALVLIHHPDKTVHLSASERAQHAATFREIQEAYDVLTNASMKAAYDVELGRHGNKVNLERSTFHRAYSFSFRCSTTSTPTPSSTSSKPTPGAYARKPSYRTFSCSDSDRIPLRFQCQSKLIATRLTREDRRSEDSLMDDAALRYTLSCWKDIAAQQDVKDNALDAAFVQIMIHEYTQKVADREAEHEEWLKKMASPKKTPQPSSHSTSRTRSQAKTPTPAQSTKASQKASAKNRAQDQKAAEDASRAQARAAEKASKETLRQAQVEAKAAAVRAAKEKAMQLAAEEARKKQEQIRRVREKVAPKPKPKPETAPAEKSKEAGANGEPPKTSVKKECGTCGEEHASLAEWKKCSVRNWKERGGSSDEGFVTVV